MKSFGVKAIVFIFATVFFISCVVRAEPIGNAPPENYQISSYWYWCIGPNNISMQGNAVIFDSPTKKSRKIATLKQGDAVTIIDAVNVVIEPGLAVAIRNYETDYVAIPTGQEVIVLGEWEIDYFHAWYDGKEVEGGLPIGDSRTFSIIKMPLTESWLKIKSKRLKNKIGWALDDESFNDSSVYPYCEHAQ